MLPLSANLKWLFTEWAFEERFAAAAAAGFTAVEYASPYEYSTARLRALLQESGLRQVLINSPSYAGAGHGSGIACHPDKIGLFREGFENALQYANDLSCPFIHLLGGIKPADCSREHALDIYAENVAWAAHLAARSGRKVLIEAINQRDAPGFILHTLEQAVTLISAIGDKGLGLLFDVYHCQVQQGDITTHLTRCLPWIDHIQIADVPLRNEPGTGEIAWQFLLRHIETLGYRGHIGCEYRPAVSTLEGLKWSHLYGEVQGLGAGS
ncbi:MAG: hydroxypyruvate isomerase family protein [Janthinobacterium lividum]